MIQAGFSNPRAWSKREDFMVHQFTASCVLRLAVVLSRHNAQVSVRSTLIYKTLERVLDFNSSHLKELGEEKEIRDEKSASYNLKYSTFLQKLSGVGAVSQEQILPKFRPHLENNNPEQCDLYHSIGGIYGYKHTQITHSC